MAIPARASLLRHVLLQPDTAAQVSFLRPNRRAIKHLNSSAMRQYGERCEDAGEQRRRSSSYGVRSRSQDDALQRCFDDSDEVAGWCAGTSRR